MNREPVQRNQDEYTARVDQNFGEKNFLWFRISGMLQTQNSAGSREALVSTNDSKAKNIGVSWVHTFGPSSVLQMQMGRTTLFNPTGTSFKDLPASFNKDVGFSPSFVDHYVGGTSLVPNMNVTDFFAGGEGVTNALGSDIWQGKANYSKVIGAHTLKFGGEFNSSGWDQVLTTVNSIFVSFDTSDPQNSARTGSALASYLLNVPDQANAAQHSRDDGLGRRDRLLCAGPVAGDVAADGEPRPALRPHVCAPVWPDRGTATT